MTRDAVLWSASFSGNAADLESIRTSASTRIEIFSRKLNGVEDLASAFDDATRAKAQAAIFMTDNTLFGQRKLVAELALTHGFPTIHSFLAEVREGMFYGPSYEEDYRRAAALADKILRGARPSELPVENPNSSWSSISKPLTRDAKATQAAREAQKLPPGPERIEAMKKADGFRHAADTYNYLIFFPANSNRQIDRGFRRQSHHAGDAHFVTRIVVSAFRLG